jgi:thiol:disulfide interchange protein DsbD
MFRKIALVLLILVVGAGSATAQMKTSADVVSATPALGSVSAAAGKRVDFTINLDIAKKWHIYAHGDTNFIGVDLVPSELFPLDDFEAEYPHGHEGVFFGEKVMMIEGKDVIKASALIPEGMPAGEYPLDFGVTVQACDDKTCLQPVDLPVNIRLLVK